MKFHRDNLNLAGSRGFTFIEMAIVVVIIGIMAAIAVPMFSRTIPRIKTRAEARNILNSIRTARSRAIAENVQYGVYFNASAKSYRLFKDKVDPSHMTYDPGDSTIGAPIILDGDVVYTGINFTNNCVIMKPTGAASESGSVAVDDTDGDSPFRIEVLAATGKTKLQ
jgi:prepilin-type N-terminal cleavage/methylation domain-containing protein